MTAKQILIVDDEPGILETLSGVLTDEGYEVRTTASGEEAPSLYSEQQPDVVFLDIWLEVAVQRALELRPASHIGRRKTAGFSPLIQR